MRGGTTAVEMDEEDEDPPPLIRDKTSLFGIDNTTNSTTPARQCMTTCDDDAPGVARATMLRCEGIGCGAAIVATVAAASVVASLWWRCVRHGWWPSVRGLAVVIVGVVAGVVAAAILVSPACNNNSQKQEQQVQKQEQQALKRPQAGAKHTSWCKPSRQLSPKATDVLGWINVRRGRGRGGSLVVVTAFLPL
eukprot:CAMPEP_0175928652 /NCGR_PEP_ID=MMETSP0108-20121206/17361_1 /TAXON_ID=195067 ORGANISM="Goniomonas pacifica, Strain CCMP1869" /NCGR_SAMPLE_ID=MMETSP0108 /ASSEMBLY_ACC=CAM_ASM_000204 /LENGTH=192 /DNA_ID=CAMNT_0017252019 /DNA_START=463 /DNA_END=1039 /DNA_ORIENTATION=+